ncbi:MAG: WG repeat-containing protein, partial [Bacteroidales bacterium]|nr:WG repeat-containing protein [Bacteroidales bacterium]
KRGKIVVQPIYDYISDFRKNLAAAFLEDKACFVNIKGEQISPLIYDDIATESGKLLSGPDFINGFVKVRVNDKFGFVNELGEFAIPAIYDSADDFTRYGMARVSINGKYGFINKMGELTIQAIYDKIEYFINSPLYIVNQDNKWGVINEKGDKVFDIKYDKIFGINKGYIIVEINGNVERVNSSGKILSHKELEAIHNRK